MLYPSSKTLFSDIVSEITAVYPENEAKSIAYLLLAYAGSLSKTDILLDKPVELRHDIAPLVLRLQQHEPIQYIIGEGDFYGRLFYVSPDTLIPRPETEELVAYVLENAPLQAHKIIDIGTGTGCIAISLALDLPQAQVTAYDISEKALAVAQQNKQRHKAGVRFIQQDFLAVAEQTQVEPYDIIVSNPPYVTHREKEEMLANVLAYEPHLALFVPDENPLLFYKALAQFAWLNLSPAGFCAVEINQYLGQATAESFQKAGFGQVELLQDFFGRERFVVARR